MINRFDCSIENYIRDGYSICREERQYNLYLYNILRKYRNPESRKEEEVGHIFECCGLKNAVVENVFYEATFMRDFFMRNRVLANETDATELETILQQDKSPNSDHKVDVDKSFDAKLIRFCEAENIENPKGKIDEMNYGHWNNKDKIKTLKVDGSKGDKDAYIRCMRRMMNAKPDLAVIYKEQGSRYLLFLECKFESNEQQYKCNSEIEKELCLNQRRLQGSIARFLCEQILVNDGICVSERMQGREAVESKMVRFTREEEESQDKIPISVLIRLNDLIFE